jgi:hypothetical protein
LTKILLFSLLAVIKSSIKIGVYRKCFNLFDQKISFSFLEKKLYWSKIILTRGVVNRIIFIILLTNSILKKGLSIGQM